MLLERIKMAYRVIAQNCRLLDTIVSISVLEPVNSIFKPFKPFSALNRATQVKLINTVVLKIRNAQPKTSNRLIPRVIRVKQAHCVSNQLIAHACWRRQPALPYNRL